MTIRENFAARLSLAELQSIVNDKEPGLGPVEGSGTGEAEGAPVTLLDFDDAVIVEAPVTTLLPAASAAPAGRIAYTRGRCLIGGQAQDVVAYVPLDELFLVRRV